jgi:hypothetical protein
MDATINGGGKYAAAKGLLETAESGKGALLQKQPVVVKSTAFYNPNATITDATFFTNTALDYQWQSNDFPSKINLYRFTHVRISDNLQFEVSNILRFTQTLRGFIEGSFLKIGNNGLELTTIPLARMTQYKFIPANNVAGPTANFVEVKENFNNEFKLTEPITFNSNENPEFTLVVAKNYATPTTYTANVAPVITGNTGGSLATAGQGYYITIELRGYKAKPNQAV